MDTSLAELGSDTGLWVETSLFELCVDTSLTGLCVDASLKVLGSDTGLWVETSLFELCVDTSLTELGSDTGLWVEISLSSLSSEDADVPASSALTEEANFRGAVWAALGCGLGFGGCMVMLGDWRFGLMIRGFGPGVISNSLSPGPACAKPWVIRRRSGRKKFQAPFSGVHPGIVHAPSSLSSSLS
ncbi:MAG: hypothetical protein HY301_14100 [Verrucomicrobia bacterium]|nr:hypothetical protein [Verrucomicrobiota bacterium]